MNAFPTFFDAARRIYMSATIADDSEIIRTFGATIESVSTALTSRSLAGISERMIIIPELMPSRIDVLASTVKEFAYFGFGLTFISAGIAHFATGDPIFFVVDPLIFFGVLIVSYVYFNRR